MKKTQAEAYEVSISKEQLNDLPVQKYDGDIVIISHREAVADAVAELRKAEVIGFDTETKPSFQKGQLNHVALLQLSTDSKCFLFRLSKLGLPQEIKSLLEDETVCKVGLSIKDDFHSLAKISQLNPQGFIDLQDYVRKFHISDSSLTKIHGILFGHRISKGQQLTNWEAPTLTARQQEYAALDAKACIAIYRALSSGEFEPSESQYAHPPVTPDKPLSCKK